MQKEYIERGELESILHNRYDKLAGLRPDFYAGYMMAFHTIEDDVPTAADVVEVVRCEKCEYFDNVCRHSGKVFNFKFCTKHIKITGPDDFCSHGIRRKDT